MSTWTSLPAKDIATTAPQPEDEPREVLGKGVSSTTVKEAVLKETGASTYSEDN